MEWFHSLLVFTFVSTSLAYLSHIAEPFKAPDAYASLEAQYNALSREL